MSDTAAARIPMREIPVTARAGMLVPARVYADDELWTQISKDRSLEQLLNVATLAGVSGFVCGMPDMHEGYGFPVGGVAAMRVADGIISPGGVGYDINCGVRLLASTLELDAVRSRIEPLVHDLSRGIPSGAGHGTHDPFTDVELDDILARGCRALVERGWVHPEDLAHTEAWGSLAAADPAQVSARAKNRGRDQLGTIGSGNHFVEVQVVDEVFDVEAARAFGLRTGCVAVLVHTGSRGLGHQVCTDYVRRMDEVMPSYGITAPVHAGCSESKGFPLHGPRRPPNRSRPGLWYSGIDPHALCGGFGCAGAASSNRPDRCRPRRGTPGCRSGVDEADHLIIVGLEPSTARCRRVQSTIRV